MTEAVLRYPGSKWRLARWIVDHMPPHSVYLEPFFGSGAVYFTKLPSKMETVNDLSGDVVNLFRQIRDHPAELARLIEMTPYARQEYYGSYTRADDPLEQARRFLVRCWMSIGAKHGSTSGWRSVLSERSRHGTVVPQWNKLPARIAAVTARLKDAQIENQPAAQLIPRFAYPEVLIYADPPYPLSTRTTPRMYAWEMTDDDHIQLLDLLDAHPGPVILSGYACSLYDQRLRHWRRETTTALANSGRTAEEVLWLNPVAATTMRQTTLV